MKNYQHSVILDEKKCIGCTNCIKVCPTQAIRVRNGKAIILDERCIDCGECIKTCPHYAKDAMSDSINMIKQFSYKIAIVPPVFLSQFNDELSTNAILTAVKNMGFDDVRETAYSAEILGKVLYKEIEKEQLKKPVISSYCPTVQRLVQGKFPELINHMSTLESPMEVEGRFAREELKKKGLKDEDVGVFFITPCPARISSIKNNLQSKKKSSINGAIAIKDIYIEVRRNIRSQKEINNYQKSSAMGVYWAASGGEREFLDQYSSLIVDGIHSVNRVLNETERGGLRDIIYLEALACREGCAGGALVLKNNFIAKQRILKRAKKTKEENFFSKEEMKKWYDSGLLHITDQLTPKGMEPLDENIGVAIQKAEEIEKITKKLPYLDCGSCGAPTCFALAEDIVRGKAKEEDCIFLLKEEVKKIGHKEQGGNT